MTERDIVRRVATAQPSFGRTSVRIAMSSPIVAISPDASIEEAPKVMAHNRIHRPPVVGETGLLELVTLVDAARALAEKAGLRSVLIDVMLRRTGAPEGVYE